MEARIPCPKEVKEKKEKEGEGSLGTCLLLVGFFYFVLVVVVLLMLSLFKVNSEHGATVILSFVLNTNLGVWH